jgi:hypothetical protein
MKRLRLLFFSSLFLVAGIVSCNDKNKTNNKTSDNNSETAKTVPKPTENVEEFRLIDSKTVEELNLLITSKKINSEEDIMREYSPEDKTAEGDYSYVIKQINTRDSNSVIISLLEDGINDDSIKARKVIMTLIRKDGRFVVKQIKESYKCWKERGHENWSSAFCM